MVSKNDGLPRFNLKLSVELHKKLKVLCAMEGITMQDKIVAILEEYLKRFQK